MKRYHEYQAVATEMTDKFLAAQRGNQSELLSASRQYMISMRTQRDEAEALNSERWNELAALGAEIVQLKATNAAWARSTGWSTPRDIPFVRETPDGQMLATPRQRLERQEASIVELQRERDKRARTTPVTVNQMHPYDQTALRKRLAEVTDLLVTVAQNLSVKRTSGGTQ